MKKLIVLIEITYSVSLFAQPEYNSMNWIYSFDYKKPLVSLIPAVEAIDVDLQVTYAKNGKVKKYRSVYDQFGNLTLHGEYKDNDFQVMNENKFNEKGKVLQTKRFKKGKIKREVTFAWNEKDKITHLKHIKNGDKLVTIGKWTYKDEDCLVSSVRYKDDSETIDREWRYEYYDDCQKKRSVLLNGKGKVKKEWTYDCKEEGEVMEKKKDVTQVCKWEESSGEYLTKVIQSFDDKGRTFKSVSKYRIADTALVSYKRYNHKEELTYEASYDFDPKRPLKTLIYKKGEVFRTYEYKYIGDQLVAYNSYRKGKNTSKLTYTYNDQKQLASFSTYRKGNVLVRTGELKYN